MFRRLKNIFILQMRFNSSLANECIASQNVIQPCSNVETRLLKVGIIGLPNAGKSTFINNLIDRKVCPASMKVHTTRKKSMAIFTADDAQIVFMDTPGLVNNKEQKKYNLEKSFVSDTMRISQDVDIIGVIHDVSNHWTRERLDIKIINLLEKQMTPSFLVLNKVDVLKNKRRLLDITRQLTLNCIDGKPIPGRPYKQKNENDKGWINFHQIFMASALTGDGLQEVKDFLISYAKPAKWMFPEQVWTDQSAENLITTSVHAAFLDFLPQEIPYQLKTEIEYFNINEKGVITTAVLIHCPSVRVANLIAGAADGRLRQITEKVQRDLQETFHNFVKIKIALTPR